MRLVLCTLWYQSLFYLFDLHKYCHMRLLLTAGSVFILLILYSTVFCKKDDKLKLQIVLGLSVMEHKKCLLKGH